MAGKLIIAGAGGFGREVADWAAQSGWDVLGFIDDNFRALEGIPAEVPLLGSIAEHQPDPSAQYAVAIAKPAAKAAVWEMLAVRSASFGSIVHPTVVLGSSVELGPGAILCPGCVLTNAIRLGRGVTLNLHCCIGHDCVLGDFCHLNSYTQLGGNTDFAERVTTGAHACLLPGSRVGAGAMVGAGAVVTRPVKPGKTVFGNPARVI